MTVTSRNPAAEAGGRSPQAAHLLPATWVLGQAAISQAVPAQGSWSRHHKLPARHSSTDVKRHFHDIEDNILVTWHAGACILKMADPDW